MNEGSGPRKLELIDLSGSPITDASIESLAKIPNLKQVYVTGAKISPEGITKRKAANAKLNLIP
jgi:hypothetical protein